MSRPKRVAYAGDMPDLKTVVSRKWVLVLTAGQGGDGVLTLSQQDRRTLALELDVYGLEEKPPEFFACRTFNLLRLSDDECEEYRCTIGPVTRCWCPAGRKSFRRNSCKHVDALTRIITRGVLPPRQVEGA